MDLTQVFKSSSNIAMLGEIAEKWLSDFFFIKNIHQYDIRKLKCRYSNSVYKIIKDKYSNLIKTKYNHVFKLSHPAYKKKKNVEHKVYLENKKLLYLDVLNYYNTVIVSFLQKFQHEEDIISISNYTFREMPNFVEKIK